MCSRIVPTIMLVAVLLTVPATAATGDNVVLRWSAATLEAIRQSALPPPAVARALAIVHTCIYDAWAAYDPVAAGVHYHGKRVSASDEDSPRAISYAAYRALVDLFPARRSLFDELMTDLGYDPLDASHAASQLGIDAAQAGLDVRAGDGANQRGGYADYTGYAPANTPDTLVDPFRWQPLRMTNGSVQQFAQPHWGLVTPFAPESVNEFPPPPVTFQYGLYREQAIQILHLSARLTDREKAIAGYWADGPRTETPPGHWCLFAEFVSRRDAHTLEQDVKLFFALSNAVLDASIAVWKWKVYYDYVRPVTAIRFLFGGQPVRAWAGPFLGTQLIPGDTWQSYIPTPPFAEYMSGHSTFSASAAEILRSFTGSDRLDAQALIPAGTSPIEPGVVPRADVLLSWRTFSEAADEAGLSRRYGGIHFEDGDLAGRALGRRIGAIVWEKARGYFDGVPMPFATRGGATGRP